MKCKIYFKLKNGRTLKDSNCFELKDLTEKDIKFLTGRNSKHTILKKLYTIRDADDVTADLNSVDQDLYDKLHTECKMLDYIIHNLEFCNEQDGYVDLKYVNFKIIVKPII